MRRGQHGESHGHCRRGITPTYHAWQSMKARCLNPRTVGYPAYGGSGITVCDQWRDSFTAFLRDVGERPSPQHSLDRYPNLRGGYEPGNVRWATPLQQHNNKRTNRLLTFRGETHSVTEWARLTGLSPTTIFQRLHQGWTVADALTLARLSRSETRRGHRPMPGRPRPRAGARQLTHEGVTQTLWAWAQTRNLSYYTLHQRLALGWSVARTLDTPRPPWSEARQGSRSRA